MKNTTYWPKIWRLQAPNIVSQPPEVSKKNSALMGVPRIMEVAQSDLHSPPLVQN